MVPRHTLADVLAHARSVHARMPEIETDPGGIEALLADMDALATERKRATALMLGDPDSLDDETEPPR